MRRSVQVGFAEMRGAMMIRVKRVLRVVVTRGFQMEDME